ncbi:uncharacterized protein [Palaemon carinicauda]|uniref:uncharacterized protein n=1 Tax=Palaemon carinicauda TaxID=392227 RepID=UPI0035B5B8A0
MVKNVDPPSPPTYHLNDMKALEGTEASRFIGAISPTPSKGNNLEPEPNMDTDLSSAPEDSDDDDLPSHPQRKRGAPSSPTSNQQVAKKANQQSTSDPESSSLDLPSDNEEDSSTSKPKSPRPNENRETRPKQVEDADPHNPNSWIEVNSKGKKSTVQAQAPVPSTSNAPSPFKANESTKFPKFKIQNNSQFPAYDRVIVIEKDHPGINMAVKPNLEGDMILSPKDLTAVNILKTLNYVVELDPSQLKRIYIVCGYSFKCQRYGHHQNNCKAAYPICGICSKRHDTAICLTKYKADEPTTAKCPQCHKGHHSWNKRCPERLRREHARRNQTPSNSNTAGTRATKPAQQQPDPRQNQVSNNSRPTSHSGSSYRDILQGTQNSAVPNSRVQHTNLSQQTPPPSNDPVTPPRPQRTPRSPRVPRQNPQTQPQPQPNPPPSQQSFTPPEIIHSPQPSTSYAPIPQAPTSYSFTHFPSLSQQNPSQNYSQSLFANPLIGLLLQPQILETAIFTLLGQFYPGLDQNENFVNAIRNPASVLDANLLFAAAETQDTIISGDFNAHHPFLKSPSLTNATGDHLHSLLEDFPGVKLLNNVDIPTHIAGGRLDLTFVSHNLTYGSSWDLHPLLTSDHYGTVSSFRLDKLPDPPPPPRRWNPDFAHWDLFEQHMTSWAERYSVRPPEDADNILLSLNNQLNEAAASSMPKKKSFVKDHKDSWYYNPRIKAMNKRLNRVRKLFRRNNTEALYQTLISVARHATEVANDVKKEKWLEWCSQVSGLTPIRKIWAWFNKVSGKRYTARVTHPDPPAEALRIAQNFANRSKSENLSIQARQRQEVLYPIRMNMVTAGCNIPDDTDALYTMDELNTALSKNKDTAPGADNITYSMLKHMGNPAKEIYLKLINKTHVERVRPQLWRQQDTQPVPKPKEENAYRPIALITCTAKVAERMVLNRLKWKVGDLHHRLYAFREGVGTHECITDLMATINEERALVVFLDLEKAFELASAAAILFSLVRKRVRGHLLSWVHEYTKGREARVSFQGATSPFLPLENGTPQGGILSPFLFNVLMENLLFIELPRGIEIFIYADDICIVCPNSIRNQSQKMQRALNAIAHECNELGLKINPLKTKAMAIKYFEPPPPLLINDNPIEWVPNFIYLGVNINHKFLSSVQVKLLKNKVNNRYNAMKRICTLNKGATSHLLRLFYVQAVRSQVEYASPVLTSVPAVSLTSLEVIQNNAMRLITGSPMWTRLHLLRQETNLLSLADRIKMRMCCVIVKTIKVNRTSPLKTRLNRFINLHENLDPPNNYIGSLVKLIRDVNIQQTINNVKHDKFHPSYVPPAPWSKDPIEINYTVLPAFKSQCSIQQLKTAAQDSINSTSSTNVYYTDGSVDINIPAAGSAVFSRSFSCAWRLSDHASILQAELYAIAKALENSLYKYGNTTIHTDSRGAIQSITKRNFSENIHLISTIKAMAAAHALRNRKVTINWIPSHVGVQGNDEADRLANSALRCPTVDKACRPSLSHIKKLMNDYCHIQKKSLIRQVLLEGSRSATWYTSVTNLLPHNIPKSLNRKLTVIIFRLRLGYLCTWQLIDIEDRPCLYCDLPTGDQPLEHYLLHCRDTFPLRQTIASPPPYTAVQKRSSFQILDAEKIKIQIWVAEIIKHPDLSRTYRNDQDSRCEKEKIKLIDLRRRKDQTSRCETEEIIYPDLRWRKDQTSRSETQKRSSFQIREAKKIKLPDLRR